MNCVFYSNGIIIQGVNNIPDNYSSDDIFPFGYYGIERYVTWPLEYEEDSTSMMLSNEISQKWLSDDIFSLYTVNDQDLLCRALQQIETAYPVFIGRKPIEISCCIYVTAP